MRGTILTFCIAIATSSVTSVGHPAKAGSYVFTSLDAPGQTGTIGYGINDAGQVVGSSGRYGFVWQNGVYTLVSPAAAGSNPVALLAINAKGVAAGTYQSPPGRYASFTYAAATGLVSAVGPTSTALSSGPRGVNIKGVVAGEAYTILTSRPKYAGFTAIRSSNTKIQVPGAVFGTQVAGISDSGLVGGYYYDASRVIHGFTYDSVYLTFDVPGSLGTLVELVTGTGTLAGEFFTNSSGSMASGFIDEAGSFTTFTYPGATVTDITAIGPGSEPIGVWYNTDISVESSFVVVGGTYYAIAFPHSLSTYIYGVNSQGTLVGSYEDRHSVWHGFIAKCAADQKPCTS